MQEYLEQYVNYLNHNQYPDNEIFTKLMEASRKDKNLETLLYQLPNANLEERKALLDQYLNSNNTKEEEVIAETFGIDTSFINHLVLQNGKEIFSFYQPNINKQIVLENKKEENLAEQLKKWQEEHPNIEDRYKMLQEQRMEKGELKFVPIDKVNEYGYLVNKLKEEEKQALDYLIKNKDQFLIQAVNIENVLGMDKNGQIVESYLDKNTMEFRLEKPKENLYSKQNETNVEKEQNTDVETEQNVDENIDIEKQPNDEENIDIEKQLEEEGLNKDQIKNVKEKLELYTHYPELLEYLTPEDKIFYEKYLNIYRKIKEQEQKEKPKVYQKTMENGYVDVLILSLVTSFAGGMFITLILALTSLS